MMFTPRISDFIYGVLCGFFIATLFLAVLLHWTNATRSTETKLVLKLGHTLDSSHPTHMGIVHMNERLEVISNGTMRIAIYPGGMLGSESQCLEQVQNGQISMTKTSTAMMEAFWPEIGIFSVPYVFRDETHFRAVLDGPIGKEFLTNPPQLHGLGYYDAGTRCFYTVKRPIRTPEDLKGLKIRVQQSRMAMNTVSSLGAAPTPIAWGELYTAMAQGNVDGAENNIPSFVSGRHDEVCKHFTLNEHVYAPDMLLINKTQWESLSPQQRRWLQQAVDESVVFQRDLWQRETQKAIKDAEAKGVTFYEVDRRLFAETVAPMVEKITDTKIQALRKRIGEMK
jgi:tripartite ATP-independent transporter DctP family solute receptor